MQRMSWLVAMAGWLVFAFPALAHCGHHDSNDCGDCGYGGCGHHGMSARRSPNGASSGQAAAAPAAVETREGKVAEVVYLPGPTRDTAMVELRILAGTSRVLARLAPAGFLHQNEMDIREGDTVSVTGYWVASGDGEMLVATRLARQGKTVQLRDGRGQSAW